MSNLSQSKNKIIKSKINKPVMSCAKWVSGDVFILKADEYLKN